MEDIIKTLETKQNETELGTEEVEVIVNQIINKTRKYDSHVDIKSIDKMYN